MSVFFIGILAFFSSSRPVHASGSGMPEFAPCDPVSDFLESEQDSLGFGVPDPEFCSDWNPEFPFNGHHCCTKVVHSRRRGGGKLCLAHRRKGAYCDEVTQAQHAYIDAVQSGKIKDVLQTINQEMGRGGEQAYCSVNNGFLVNGRSIVPTERNRIRLRAPQRCTSFGTDGMAGMLEWVGRAVKEKYSDSEYSGVHLLIGDISAPRGGCLAGSSGGRGHASHTTGQDADVGFLTVKSDHQSPESFHRSFDAKTNWWMVKQIFNNPYVCVRVIFLDRRHIRSLSRVAAADEEWLKVRRFVRHMPGHKNHMHVRIGASPGPVGCSPDAKPELEFEDDSADGDFPEVN